MDFIYIKSGVTALIISVLFTPLLIYLSKKKGFFASIDHRSSHLHETPNTGGIILCFSVIIPLLLYSTYSDQEEFSLLLSAFAVLLITGIIDDFNPIPVFYKFIGQFVPAIVIVLSVEAQHLIIPFLSDYLEIPLFFNYLFWIFFIVISINAFNLIDGIDGLAISLGIVGGIYYLIKFIELGQTNLVIFDISLIGGLGGLLFYNFNHKYKIFIGDTGSLFIGGLLVFFGIKFLDFEGPDASKNSFFLVIGSLFIPLADLVRVAISRLLEGVSPFKADRKHVHHLLVDWCHGNHIYATTILVIAQILMILLFQITKLQSSAQYFFATISAITGYIIVISLLALKVRRKLTTSYD
jgi:UDP-GlcNAc:undecaprenyl-phosphate GlcNAc-1-phosphate transferase